MFRYLNDGLFLGCSSAYVVNRFVFKPNLDLQFLHSYFNDVLLIPCALPPLLFAQSRCGVRQHDTAPTAWEVGLHLAIWSLYFELLGPAVQKTGTSDPWDVVAYVVGGLLAWWIWSLGNSQPVTPQSVSP